HLGHFPTPLEPMRRFSHHLGAAEIWIKRDDCTGLAGGGNKTRKLEYLISDAFRAGADTLTTTGALQSNHARQTALDPIYTGKAMAGLMDFVQTQKLNMGKRTLFWPTEGADLLSAYTSDLVRS